MHLAQLKHDIDRKQLGHRFSLLVSQPQVWTWNFVCFIENYYLNAFWIENYACNVYNHFVTVAIVKCFISMRMHPLSGHNAKICLLLFRLHIV